MIKQKKLPLLILILIISGLLRFYNLMHDAPYFFDPDERNMAIAITRFVLPSKLSSIPSCIYSEFFSNRPTTNDQRLTTNCSLNPHFFAYGQFPLYLSFVSDQTMQWAIRNFHFTEVIDNKAIPLSNNFLSTSFPQAFFWLRFYSALSSLVTVLLVYKVIKILLREMNIIFTIKSWRVEYAHLGALISSLLPGLIQSAHFGTTESILTFSFLAVLYLTLKYQVSDLIYSFKNLAVISFILAIGISSKLTALFFLVPPILMLFVKFIKNLNNIKPKRKILNSLPKLLSSLILSLFTLIALTMVFSISLSPYSLVEPENFQSAVFGYEKDVALGKFPAFYTRQFVDTTPILFQIEKIFPYTLGMPVFILGTFGLLFIILQLTLSFIYSIVSISSKLKAQSSKPRSKLKTLRSKLSFALYTLRFTLFKKNTINKNNELGLQLFIIITSFLIYFLPNAFLFAKWTRFMTPLLPFFAIFAAFAVQQIYQVILNLFVKTQSSKLKAQNHILNLKTNNRLKFLVMVLTFALCVLSLLPGAAYMSIYTNEDSRVTASKWIYQNIPDNSYILSETANVVDIPLGLPTNLPAQAGDQRPTTNDYTVISFDFYHLDENPRLFENLITHLARADYILIPSRRIFANYTKFPAQFPLVTKYYQLLLSGRLGFDKVAEINSFPQLSLSSPGRWPFGLLPGVSWQFPDENAEETFTVFDHPVIRIYKKTKNMNPEEYKILFLFDKLS